MILSGLSSGLVALVGVTFCGDEAWPATKKTELRLMFQRMLQVDCNTGVVHWLEKSHVT